MRVLPALTFVIVAGLLTGCSTADSSDEQGTGGGEATETAVPVADTHTVSATGYVMLNGYVIVPSGSDALCTRQADKTTAIIGDIGSNTAASVIIESGAVTNVYITDPEDTLTLTPGHGEADLKIDDHTHTVTGQAPGVRKAELTSGEMPMTFELAFTCA